MKITICGSLAFFDEMQDVQKQLESMGHIVKLPPSEMTDEKGKAMPVKEYYALRKQTETEDGWIWDRKAEAMRNHFGKVAWSDAILVLNYTKNGIENYIGANTLLEMGLAFHLDKTIFLLNRIPDISYREEILGMKPIVVYGDLNFMMDKKAESA